MKYSDLKKVKAPKVLVEAIKLFGVKEFIGSDHNAVILAWAENIGLKKVYTNDEIPWCGLFVATCCKNAGKEIVKSPLWARDWLNWGTKETVAKLGDVLVFSRNSGGHVGFYVGEDKTHFHVLGGNQSNEVCVTRINKDRCIGIRRTKWKTAPPTEVAQVFLSENGIISTNER